MLGHAADAGGGDGSECGTNTGEASSRSAGKPGTAGCDGGWSTAAHRSSDGGSGSGSGSGSGTAAARSTCIATGWGAAGVGAAGPDIAGIDAGNMAEPVFMTETARGGDWSTAAARSTCIGTGLGTAGVDAATIAETVSTPGGGREGIGTLVSLS